MAISKYLARRFRESSTIALSSGPVAGLGLEEGFLAPQII